MIHRRRAKKVSCRSTLFAESKLEKNWLQFAEPNSDSALKVNRTFVAGTNLVDRPVDPCNRSEADTMVDLDLASTNVLSAEIGHEGQESPLSSRTVELERNMILSPKKVVQSQAEPDLSTKSETTSTKSANKPPIFGGGNTSKGRLFGGIKNLEFTKKQSELDAELSNVRKIREKFASKPFREKRSSERLQQQEKASELRLVRRMRENSLKEMEMMERENLKARKQAIVSEEFENVRRIRSIFSGQECDIGKEDSMKKGAKDFNFGRLDGFKVGAVKDAITPRPLSKTATGAFSQDATELNKKVARSVTNEELDMIRNIRMNMSFEDEDIAVFEDPNKNVVDLEHRLEMAKRLAENPDDLEACPMTASVSDWVRYYRSHAEFTPQKLDSGREVMKNDAADEVRQIRENYASDEVMAERRRRAASEKVKSSELEKELSSVRSTRQNMFYSPSSRSDNVHTDTDLEDVRRLRRTKSLGSHPAFTGESFGIEQKSKPLIFGGVNILPYREVAISDAASSKDASDDDNQHKSSKPFEEKISTASSLIHDRTGGQDFEENEESQRMACARSQETLCAEKDKVKGTSSGYMIV